MRIFIIVLLFLVSCTPDSQKVVRILQGAGYTNIQLGGYPLFACSDDDTFNVEFTAVGPTTQPVRGAVCCGLFKNCTIRID